ncbi:MAG: Gldg family protein, partial [Burkholderiales bacterium]
MKKGFLYSTAGIAALVVAIVLVNWVLGMSRARVDLTEGNLYSLSEATRTTLHKLAEPITIRYYANPSDDTVPIQVRVFAKRVEDLLAEYRAVNRDKVTIEKLIP